jgi:hypothetical protein
VTLANASRGAAMIEHCPKTIDLRLRARRHSTARRGIDDIGSVLEKAGGNPFDELVHSRLAAPLVSFFRSAVKAGNRGRKTRHQFDVQAPIDSQPIEERLLVEAPAIRQPLASPPRRRDTAPAPSVD